MALAADPSVTLNVAGGSLASQSLGASANVTFVVDFSTNSLGGWLQIWDVGGSSVAATNGLKVQVFGTADSTSNYDTVELFNFTITTVASTSSRQSVLLPTGKYQFKLTNLDATNSITVEATAAPIA